MSPLLFFVVVVVVVLVIIPMISYYIYTRIKTMMRTFFIFKVKNFILKSGGKIYGGAVRDYILHLKHGTTFEPRDFDVNFANNQDIDTFKKVCEQQSYRVKELASSIMTGSGNNRGRIVHYKFLVSSSFFSTTVEVCKSVAEPPYGKCDFSCNLFVETLYGIRPSNSLGKEIYGVDFPNEYSKKRLLKIATGLIENKVFYRIRDVNDLCKRGEVRLISNRIRKMERRGWTVKTKTWQEVYLDGQNCELMPHLF